ncbi:MAG: hypothetical protein KatS3mg085_090 [Candidatus Dojkabacteria bacterium]|nr:MAG: hypothetical protein KatS3mg085_090 [Candidatus Dojkabacteria bacterium]
MQQLKSITEQITKRKQKFYSAMGSSDARHYARIGIPAVEFGPIGGGIASDEEWVDIDSLIEFYNILQNFVKNEV